MADPLPKVILRQCRQIFIWPLEAALVYILYYSARLLPAPIASWLLGGFMR